MPLPPFTTAIEPNLLRLINQVHLERSKVLSSFIFRVIKKRWTVRKPPPVSPSSCQGPRIGTDDEGRDCQTPHCEG